ncbi:MAG TPA: YebC/PmpR family DNA-binding transcriptional regulator [Candidatus Nanoarchaeia archaeon]|nr:YebC/PmpR family DNA-binding transcriptional regulator [Candidatus Nanoarchaeia archaeon]
MAGHNKWAQIKRQKGKTDAEKSKAFSKFSRLITVEAKKVNGNRDSASLKAIIERAQAINMPKDSIDRAVKKATESAAAMEANLYEAYGPGGCAMLIDTLTDNKNKAVQEVKAILARHNYELAGMGSASWAFEKSPEGGWKANTTVELTDEDLAKLDSLVSELEANDEVQAVYTNVE